MSRPTFHSDKLDGIVHWVLNVEPHTVEECVAVFEKIIDELQRNGRSWMKGRHE